MNIFLSRFIKILCFDFTNYIYYIYVLKYLDVNACVLHKILHIIVTRNDTKMILKIIKNWHFFRIFILYIHIFFSIFLKLNIN